ncbi:MAG: hypothetical protein NTV55_04990 [Planctomycetota bacterium]|nr:hypothetical protein [Planctomycetota bacterium]
MARILLAFLGFVALSSTTGCLINAYPSDPGERTKALLNQSEDLRQLKEEWKRIWFLDHPSHLTPDRIDGGIQ